MATATIPREKTAAAATWKPELHEVPIDAVDVGSNVRRDVGELDELAESIRSVGILSPIRVEESGTTDGTARYALVYGQRRLAAAKQAGLTTIPALVDAGNRTGTVLIVAQLVENLQRRDLNPLEEAAALRTLLEVDSKLTQAALAKRIGRSAPYVSNALRLLDLAPEVQAKVVDGSLTGTHARALAGQSPKVQRELADWATANEASTHALERQVAYQAQQQTAAKEEAKKREALADEAEQLLQTAGAVKGTSLLAGSGYYSNELYAVLKRRGWSLATERGRRVDGICDCDAFEVGQTWQGKLDGVRKACASKVHAEAAEKADRAKWEAKQRESAARDRERTAEARRARKPLEAYLAGDVTSGLARRLALFAIVDGAYGRTDAFLRRLDPKHVTQHNRVSAKVWGAIAKMKPEQVDAELVQVLADAALADDAGVGIRQSIGKHVPELKPAPAKKPAAKKAAKA